jgi:D-3-phosphoglycerate dehydrogenase / 2-oxoglutarate reductase
MLPELTSRLATASPIRILNVEPLGFSPEARDILNHIGDVTDLSLSRSELLSQLSDYDVLIVRFAQKINQEIIDAGIRLKAIVTAATGVDHIDVDYARLKGIAVLSLRGETEFLESVSATAEHTWALLLALTRRIPQAFNSVCASLWERDSFRGRELQGKRLGIIGLGRVGRKVAGYAQAFGLHVAAYDPYALRWTEGVERYSTLSQLLSQSEVISLHIPLTKDTVKIIGREQLALLSSGAILINTSRGGVLDEKALVDSLKSEQLAGAAVDVLCHENSDEGIHQSPLLAYARTHDNLLITPHIGGATDESMAKTEVFMASKLARFFETADRRL